MSTEDSLGGNSTNSTHGQASIQQFTKLLLLHLLSIRIILWSGKAKVTRLSLTSHRGLNCRNGNNGIEQTNPQEKLVHGSLQQNVVSIDCLGDGLEAVGISRDANKVGGDEANDGKHGSAAVTDFGLTEEGYEGGVGFGEAEWVEFEVTAFEVFSSDAVFCYCVSLIFLCRICRVKKVSREVKLMEQRDDHVAIEDKSRSEDTVHETETKHG